MTSPTQQNIPTGPASPDDSRSLLSPAVSVALLIALSVILNTFGAVFSGEKMRFLFKSVMHLSASQVATIMIVAGIPGYIRPFLGAGTDLFPLFGFHRRSYYAISWALSALGYAALALLHRYHVPTVVILMMVTGLGGNLALVVMDAVMVTIGNPRGLVGRFQAIQQGVPTIMVLLFAAKLGGYVTQHWSYERCFWASAISYLAIVPIALLIPEKRLSLGRSAHETHEEHEARLQAGRQERAEVGAALAQAAKSPGLWAIVLFVFYLIVTPGTNNAQFYYYVDVLHFSPQFIGNLAQPGSAGAVIGLALFAAGSQRLPVRSLVWGAYLMDCSLYLASMFLRDHNSAIAVVFATSLLGTIYNLCLLTLAAKACPPRIEATIYGLVVSAITLAGALGEKLGSSMYDYFGPVSHHTIAHGWFGLLWCGFAFTVIAVVFIPFLPEWARSNEPLKPRKAEAAQA